jgi:hypothetical protein
MSGEHFEWTSTIFTKIEIKSSYSRFIYWIILGGSTSLKVRAIITLRRPSLLDTPLHNHIQQAEQSILTIPRSLMVRHVASQFFDDGLLSCTQLTQLAPTFTPRRFRFFKFLVWEHEFCISVSGARWGVTRTC